MKMLLRLLITMCAIYVATRIVPGISTDGSLLALAGVALVFAVVNEIVKPILSVLSLPFIVVTLGLFLLVINALMLMLTSKLSNALGYPMSYTHPSQIMDEIAMLAPTPSASTAIAVAANPGLFISWRNA